jgi:putative FmdB family regulatory protein
MPSYDYRCNSCGRKSTLFYKSYKDYEAASADKTAACPHCGSHDLTRVISRVAIPKPGRSYGKMNANEMLSVLEGGDSREVGEMFHEVGGDAAAGDPAFREITDRLRKGDDPGKIERDLGGGE